MIGRKVEGFILVARKVSFDYEEKNHSIDKILNAVSVDDIPSILVVDIWGKLKFEKCEQVESWIEIQNPGGDNVLHTGQLKMSNVRDEGMHAGIDFSTSVRFLINAQGNYYFNLFAQNELLYSYPLFVTITKT
ncbi:hypothetical protein [Paenibacillus donghaensis]|uniref:Uncharacterized protein n=1 Tax=Paenibacillus donghaensis TaxID=414771 RepID=A0A2Z2KLH7_9BACL|nr:hypothetical protein [Paenibacillus donghaensis]ASA19468.1 hypothetical protein B9T62_00530 [Paenibacillus donghaensis]